VPRIDFLRCTRFTLRADRGRHFHAGIRFGAGIVRAPKSLAVMTGICGEFRTKWIVRDCRCFLTAN
jgi:hypothetical protein